jgi:putative transcriptional regulator
MFAENLKDIREKAGFTQASFAKTLGLPLRTIQNWEQGHREPRLDMLATLATVLGVTADELLMQSPSKSVPKNPRSRPRKKK